MPQSLHDWVLDHLANTNAFKKFAEEKGYAIAKNPGEEKVRFIGKKEDAIWPDVIVYAPKAEGQPAQRIGEVEIEDTVTTEHAKGQWDVYASRVPDFILAVPKSSAKDAKRILGELKVTCDLWLYEVTFDDSGKPTKIVFT
jgi:hypothetical protein